MSILDGCCEGALQSVATTPPMTSSLLPARTAFQETLETYVEQPKESSGTYETSYPVICLFLATKLSAKQTLISSTNQV